MVGRVSLFALVLSLLAPTAGSVSSAGSQESDGARPFDDLVVLTETSRGLSIERVALDGRSLEDASSEEAQRPGVISVSPNFLVESQALPNDPQLPSQEHLSAATGYTFGVDAAGAWSRTTGSSDVVVAVADTGVRPHSEFSGRLLPGYDFVDFDVDADDPGTGGWAECPYQSSSWHGTHVAGLVAAGANGFGTVGVAPGVRILPVRVLGPCGRGSLDSIAAGILWAAGYSLDGFPMNNHPADVINLSLGGFGPCSDLEQAVIDVATSLGSLVVVAAGNSSFDAAYFSPANCHNTITVGSSLNIGSRASYSNYGSTIDVYAPGGGDPSRDGQDGLLSTVDSGGRGPKGDDYARLQGTSMASPVVSGVAALVKSMKRDATPGELAAAIRASAVGCRANTCPVGIVNAKLAVDAIVDGVVDRSIDGPVSDVIFPTKPPADPSISQDRYEGSGAAEVAEATARYADQRRSWAGRAPLRHAVIASQTSFADALTASVYAGHVDGVILFTDPERMSAATWRTITDLGITSVTLVGGPAALSETIEDRFTRFGIHVDRLWGQNRYETAVAVSEKVTRNKNYLFIASGRNFADAVSVGPILYSGVFPLVLAGSRGLDAQTQNMIIEWQDQNPSGQVVILGGYVAVPAMVEQQLAALTRPFREEDGYWGGAFCENYPSNWPRCPFDPLPVGIPSYRITRIGGADRFETAAQVATWARSRFFGGARTDVGVVSGVSYTDALAATNLLGQEGFSGPLLLTGTCTRIPKATYEGVRAYTTQRVVGNERGVCDFDAEVLRGTR